MRETSLTDLICAHHPRFVGARRAYESHTAPVEGGDVRLLSSDVVAVGVGESTTAAGAVTTVTMASLAGLPVGDFAAPYRVFAVDQPVTYRCDLSAGTLSRHQKSVA